MASDSDPTVPPAAEAQTHGRRGPRTEREAREEEGPGLAAAHPVLGGGRRRRRADRGWRRDVVHRAVTAQRRAHHRVRGRRSLRRRQGRRSAHRVRPSGRHPEARAGGRRRQDLRPARPRGPRPRHGDDGVVPPGVAVHLRRVVRRRRLRVRHGPAHGADRLHPVPPEQPGRRSRATGPSPPSPDGPAAIVSGAPGGRCGAWPRPARPAGASTCRRGRAGSSPTPGRCGALWCSR